MSLFDDIDGLLPGLLPAAWRGQRFWVINAQHSVGRRIQQVLYPGLDLKTHDDAGPLDGPIRISGLVIGDDYVEQAQALHAAFRQAGPATLIHPWRGPITCVLFRPATIEFDVKELRVARIDAEFDPVGPRASILSSITAALSALTGLAGSASALARFVLQAQPTAAAIRGRAIAAVATGIDVAGGWSARSPRAAAVWKPWRQSRLQPSPRSPRSTGRSRRRALVRAIPRRASPLPIRAAVRACSWRSPPISAGGCAPARSPSPGSRRWRRKPIRPRRPSGRCCWRARSRRSPKPRGSPC